MYRLEILNRLSKLPGVRAVGSSKTMPLSGGGEPYVYRLDDRAPGSKYEPAAGTIIVTPGYFAALGVPVLAGRDFTIGDLERRSLVIVVNRATARELWPGQSAVGKVLRLGEKARLEIIGVVGDVRHGGLANPAQPAVYVPSSRFPRGSMKIFLRFEGSSRSLAAAARTTIWSVDREQPIAEIATLPAVFSHSVARPRFLTVLLVSFGAAALALAALGLYGTLAYGIRQRTREIGIRIALGAQARDVVRMVVREGALLAAAGLALAIPASLALSTLLRGPSLRRAPG